MPKEILRLPESEEDLVKMLRPRIRDIEGALQVARLRGIQVGMLVVEYSRRPEVRKAVDEINEGKFGRPKLPHCYVAESIAEKVGLAAVYIKDCARGYLKVEKYPNAPKGIGLLKVSEKTLKLECLEQPKFPQIEGTIAGEIDGEEEVEPTQQQKDDLEALIKKTRKQITHFFYDAKGNPIARNKRQQNQFFNALNDSLEPFGWCVLPKGKQ